MTDRVWIRFSESGNNIRKCQHEPFDGGTEYVASLSRTAQAPVAVKALEWEPDHGIAGLGPYRLFQAQTPLGRYVYGTDAEGNSYWHSSSSGVFMTGDETTAKRLAEASWEKTAKAEAGRFIVLSALASSDPTPAERIETYYARQIAWSRETFGPGTRTGGVLDHIRKELKEIEAEPTDLSEWIDVIILAMDGFWRHGGTPDDLMPRLLAKQQKNMARKWPDWRTMSEDSAIEHDRGEDPTPATEAGGDEIAAPVSHGGAE